VIPGPLLMPDFDSTALPDRDSAGADAAFRLLLDALPVASLICDRDGLITYCNPEVSAVLGYAPVLRDPEYRWCGAIRLRTMVDHKPIEPDDCWIALAVRTGTPQRGEVMAVLPDGRIVTLSTQANPIRDAAGEITGAVGVVVDITEQREAALVQARLGAIVASSDDAIISKTLEGVIVTWNEGAQRVFGYTAEEAIGQPVTMIIPPERRSEERDILAKLVRGERVDHYETVRVTKHGQLLNISLTSSPIRDPSGRIVGASKIARDITLRIQHEQRLQALHDELRDADQAKNHFLVTLAHELRNPLAPIRSLVYALQHSSAPLRELPGALSVIDRQLTQLARLIDDLMDVARISRNRLELRSERLDLVVAIENAIESSRPLMVEQGHRLSIDLPRHALPVMGDATRLTQVVGNLLNNAAKYTNPGGTIALRAWRDGNDAVMTVVDNGIGIPPAMLERIFDQFVQADTSPSRSYSGLGVGLHLASRLAALHGGTLTATSQGTGHGSMFRFAVPIVEELARVEALPAATTRPVATRRVLVVDDNRDAADALTLFLSILGNTAQALYDGASLLKTAPEFAPDVILLDLGLPGLDGYEIAGRVRAEPWGRAVRLCALTGWGQDEARRRTREAGFDAHFVKPVDAVALMEAIEHLPTRSAGE
jgi:PAS domain S-box-containing protein